MSFSSLGLCPSILKAIEEQGYDKPSPIQEKAIPAVISGQDVMAAAQTGTGKTAGFTLPILERLAKGQRAKSNHVRALVLTPTRELAAQVNGSVVKYGKYLNLSSNVIFGGVKANPQMMKLRQGSDVLVATPGRLMDLHQQNAVKFSQVEVLVLDEADRMLDMGFIRDIRKILNLLPKNRQNLLFSATFSDSIRELAKGLVKNPVEISVSPRNATAKTVEQFIYPVDKKRKAPALARLVKDNNWQQVLVFSRTKHGANKLSKFLEDEGISSSAIHGNKSQGARIKALEGFKNGDVRVLVATDIAARGLDIPQLPQVVNFDLPNIAEDYVHRIGRTGRAGESGKAYSLVCADEADDLFGIERLIQKLIPRVELEGFTPVNTLPESRLNSRPVKAKKPKRDHSRNDHQDGQRSGDARRGHKPAGKNKRHFGHNTSQSSGSSKEGGEATSSDHKNNGSNFKKSPKPAGQGKPRSGNKPSGNGNGQQRRRKPQQSAS